MAPEKQENDSFERLVPISEYTEVERQRLIRAMKKIAGGQDAENLEWHVEEVNMGPEHPLVTQYRIGIQAKDNKSPTEGHKLIGRRGLWAYDEQTAWLEFYNVLVKGSLDVAEVTADFRASAISEEVVNGMQAKKGLGSSRLPSIEANAEDLQSIKPPVPPTQPAKGATKQVWPAQPVQPSPREKIKQSSGLDENKPEEEERLGTPPNPEEAEKEPKKKPRTKPKEKPETKPKEKPETKPAKKPKAKPEKKPGEPKPNTANRNATVQPSQTVHERFYKNREKGALKGQPEAVEPPVQSDSEVAEENSEAELDTESDDEEEKTTPPKKASQKTGKPKDGPRKAQQPPKAPPKIDPPKTKLKPNPRTEVPAVENVDAPRALRARGTNKKK